jgi:hypothetical protein
MIWPVIHGTQRDPKFWGPDVHEFRPERFLPENSDKLIPNAHRPFEKGPRNCIGQDLANVELKVALALTVREFDIKAAYDELDTLRNDGSIWAAWQGSKKGSIQQYHGDQMYQVRKVQGRNTYEANADFVPQLYRSLWQAQNPGKACLQG